MNSYLKPCLKPLVEFYSDNERIYFFHRPGVAVKMKDPTGFIHFVCKVMDGEKNLDEIKKEASLLFPREVIYLCDLLEALDNEYLLEDKSCNTPEILSEYDVIRWSRNIEFFGAHCKATENKYSYQEQLQSIKVTIFGLGGVGSNVLLNLAALGIKSIKVVDFDKVELSNLNRQVVYSEYDIGNLKSESAKNRLNSFLISNSFEFINKKILSSLDIEEIITDQDVVIVAIDQPRENIVDWFNTACINKNIPFICGSLDSHLITLYTIIPKQTGCIDCWKLSKQDALSFQNIIQSEKFSSAESPNVAIMPAISLVAGLISNELLKLVTGISKPNALGKLYTFNFMTLESKAIESWERSPLCQSCS